MAPTQSILTTLRQEYPGKTFLSLGETAALLGFNIKSIRNSLSAGLFPVPTVKIGHLRKVAIIDLAAFIDLQRGIEPDSDWKRRGPTRKISTE